MLKFNRLRLTGFKSFVDPTDLVIEDGLTGIVGPNGCGKSNLVEALRWVMGETSAKQMRGGEMDDVIFGGTAQRPSRNLAEVTLRLDNASRSAPAHFNDGDEIEVSRRIERGEGSLYKVNGKEVRARDVQLLFADSATGARSTALVSQGRIGAIIAAKPSERRLLLEEAAGITGLHSRRHEAELRLRAAETNLGRVDDVLVTLEAQLQNLKKQSRQTARYRNLSEHIRTAEATVFFLRWRQAEADLEGARERLKQAEASVADHTRAAGQAAAEQAERAAALPPLRQAEAERAAELQHLVIARDQLEAEERRLAEQIRDCETRVAQATQDMAREDALLADARAAIENLMGEQTVIADAREGEEAAAAEARARLNEAADAVARLDGELAALTRTVADAEARSAALARTTGELTDRIARLAARSAEFAAQREALGGQGVEAESLMAADAALTEARARLESAQTEATAAEQARSEAQAAAETAAQAENAAEAARARLDAEASALSDILGGGHSDLWPPLIDAVTVEAGYEAALGAALGEDLSAPADEAAPVRWRTLEPYAQPPALPDGVTPLATYVQAPAALARRLSQIGVITDEAEGMRLAQTLVQGQRLVSRDGGLWRWDGYTVAAGAPTAAAARLTQRNRLNVVRIELESARTAAADAAARAVAARAEAGARAEAERAAREARAAADAAYGQARDHLAALKEKAAEHESRMSAVLQALAAVDADLAEARAGAERVESERAALPDIAAARVQAETLRADLALRRAAEAELRAGIDALARAAEARRRRAEDLEREIASWRQREDAGVQRMDELADRRTKAEGERERLAGRPAEIAAERTKLMDALQAAEARRQEAADRLTEAETALAEADKALRTQESELAGAREERVRAEGSLAQGQQTCDSIAERIMERLECRPQHLATVGKIDPDGELPDLEAIERKLERLQRERETMGPVNLRAEQEADDLARQIETMQAERADLVAAIEKLRRGIAELNREGRERLMRSFEEVDKHFRQLFVRLFGGGRAHLTLTESDDPLEAGLEIMASPPGKKLQVLSLLSGGEQALTALALLFAVFQTNPAPICVLDEVDAPLDDANVDRFCTMVEEMAKGGGTRFLVITHHRMTMARMHRLFGVTMQERGISQLVSVDLQRAEELREQAA